MGGCPGASNSTAADAQCVLLKGLLAVNSLDVRFFNDVCGR